MQSDPLHLPDFAPGSVWLAGAGPGDPGLLTVLALHGLRQADVIVHDALVDSRILACANPAATLEPWGKRAAQASPKQPEINTRLIELARAGHRVLRLKGGGGDARIGQPADARACNSAVAFITGHGEDGEVPDSFDWDAIAKGAPVLVFYMALRALDRVAERLLAAGRPPTDPVAIISRATTPHQQVLETTLADLCRDASTASLRPPAILVVGPVAGLRPQLDWWTPC